MQKSSTEKSLHKDCTDRISFDVNKEQKIKCGWRCKMLRAYDFVSPFCNSTDRCFPQDAALSSRSAARKPPGAQPDGTPAGRPRATEGLARRGAAALHGRPAARAALLRQLPGPPPARGPVRSDRRAGRPRPRPRLPLKIVRFQHLRAALSDWLGLTGPLPQSTASERERDCAVWGTAGALSA